MSEAAAQRFVDGYRPGAIARVVALHMDYYAPTWGFGRAFETKVASELSEFLARYNRQRDLFLCAFDSRGDMLGSVTIDGEDAERGGAHLRWFIVSAAARGTGIGRPLLERALAFSDQNNYPKVYLTTFAGLDAARHLYESLDFRMVQESETDQWQGGVREQRFERQRSGA